MKRACRAATILLAVGLVLSVFGGAIAVAAESSDLGEYYDDSHSPEYKTFEELSGKKVAMLTGAPFEELIKSKAPGVSEFSYYNNMPDLVMALKGGKIDAFLTNNAIASLSINRSPEQAIFPHSLNSGVFGFAFEKGSSERAVWQEAYDSIPKQDIDKLWNKWTGADDSVKTIPKQDWPGNNGTVDVAVCDTLEPMSYMGQNGEIIGFDVEMLLLMAQKLDVHINFHGMEFQAILSSVQSGKAQIGAGSIIATDERKQAVDFIEYYPAAFVLVVRDKKAQAQNLEYYKNMEIKSVGVVTGTIYPHAVLERYPDAELQYYNSDADMVNALISNKVDAISMDEPMARYIVTQEEEVVLYPEIFEEMDYGMAFSKSPKGERLCDAFSEFIERLTNDGTLEKLQNKWLDRADLSTVEMEDYREYPDVNGVINLAIEQYPPFIFRRGDIICGYEAELVLMFCKENGYALRIHEMNFDGILPSLQSGKCDIAANSIIITDERKENVLFSEPHYHGGLVILVRREKSSSVSGNDFLSSIKESFNKTFIREQRWRLFVEGISRTLLITVSAIVLGTILGFMIYLLCRKGNPVANFFTGIFVWLIKGMPMVVLLMILYYILFGKSSISGTAVSIIGFTLVFGVSVFGMIKSGVAAVSIGQTEAAYALGYNDWQTFFKIVLPQALPYFIPSFKGEVTSTLKATAIVGYVAVQDLTKMGDIVRSRTYEAFFPLIAVAVVYFILDALLKFFINRIEIIIDPTRRRKEDILKGVKTNDRA